LIGRADRLIIRRFDAIARGKGILTNESIRDRRARLFRRRLS